MPSALDGFTVIDLSTGAAGAIATMFLSDNGARVIRIIPPGASLFRDGGFVVWDRGKDCAELDLEAARLELGKGAEPAKGGAASAFRDLVQCADVLIEDFAPGSPSQALVDRQWLQRVNPRLVACSITAYGKLGPLRDEPPIDDLVMARAGILSGMPGFRPAPVHVVHPLPSVAGGLFAAIGVAAALLARETTGRGRMVETSLLAGALLYHAKVHGERIDRHVFQTHPSGSAPYYSVYACADGKYLQLGCVHPGFIATAAKLMGLTELMKDDRFNGGRGGRTVKDETELRDHIARILKTRPYADWAEMFETADVPFAEARLTVDGLSDPQVLHNQMVQQLDDPAVGEVTQMGVPIRFTATAGRIRGARAARAVELASLGLKPDVGAVSTVPGMDSPPLAGYRILEITNLIAGPTTGRLLADLGADVIKLEPPAGDMSRPIGRTYFYAVNFNKRSICVDTSSPGGKRVVQQLAAKSDALVANLRPLATERMGIGPEINPQLIETHITGYGWTGPYSKRPGIDPLAQALMGLQRAQGGPENPPVFPAQLAPTDYTTGTMAALGTILALLARKRTGVVQRVDSDLLSGGILLSSPWFTRYRGKPERPLADKGQYGLGPFHRLFKMRDGWLYVAAEDDREQHAMLEALGLDSAAAGKISGADIGRHPNDTELAHKLTAVMADRSAAETLALLKLARVPAVEVPPGDSEIFLEDSHALANGFVAERQHPTAGRFRCAWQFIQFRDTRETAGRATPLLGQHTREVLREIGMASAEVDALHADGIVRTENA